MTGRAVAPLLAIASLFAVSLPAGAGAATPRASLENFLCTPAASQRSRLIEVTAVMRHIPRTQGMRLRFVLLRRFAGQSWFSPVHGRGLGSWLAPPSATLGQVPGDTWKLKRPVFNLPGPAVYRFRVTFRWIGSSGVIASQTRLTPLCAQPR